MAGASQGNRAGVKQVAVFRDPDLALGAGQFGAIQSVAPSFGVEVRPVDVRDAPAIERAITGFASTPNGGLIVTGSAAAVVHRAVIVRLAAQHKLPGVYASANMPNHERTSNPGNPASSAVGTFGISDERCGAEIA
jgi:hypothetical protein